MTTSSTHTTGRALPGAIMVMWRARPAQATSRTPPSITRPAILPLLRRDGQVATVTGSWDFTTPRLVPHRLLTGAFDEQPEDTPVACGGGLAGGTGSAPAAAVDMHGTQLIGLRSSTAGRGVDRVAPWPGRRPVAGGGRVRAGIRPRWAYWGRADVALEALLRSGVDAGAAPCGPSRRPRPASWLSTCRRRCPGIEPRSPPPGPRCSVRRATGCPGYRPAS